MTKKDPAADASSDPLAAATAKPAQDDIELLKVEVERLEKEKAEMAEELNRFKDLAARAQADLQNAKARVEREGAELRKFATEQMIRRILPTLDNFQRAFQHVPAELQSHEWVKGVSAIEADLMRQMTEAGLTRMQSLGQRADAMRHEVLMTGPGKDGEILEVFEEGYELQGKVLRPAKVRVGADEKAGK